MIRLDPLSQGQCVLGLQEAMGIRGVDLRIPDVDQGGPMSIREAPMSIKEARCRSGNGPMSIREWTDVDQGASKILPSIW